MILIVGGLIAVGIIAAIAAVFMRQKHINPKESQKVVAEVALATANTGMLATPSRVFDPYYQSLEVFVQLLTPDIIFT